MILSLLHFTTHITNQPQYIYGNIGVGCGVVATLNLTSPTTENLFDHEQHRNLS